MKNGNIKNGFSLIELMVTVGIIGILSLMALPIYKDYITKVKLTEVGLKQMYLAKQIEAEYDLGGPLAVYAFLKGFCVADITESMGGMGGDEGRSLDCTAADNRTVTAVVDTGFISVGIDPNIATYNDPKFEYYQNSFFLTDTTYESIVLYSFAGRPITNSRYQLDFRKVQGERSLKIVQKNGVVSDLEDGKWYCAISFQTDSEDWENWDDNETARKGVSPPMCNYYKIIYRLDNLFYEY